MRNDLGPEHAGGLRRAATAGRDRRLVSTTMRRRGPGPARAAAKKTAVVVGGGPAGLAAALALAHRGVGVTVLEKRAALDANRTLGYVFGLDARGQASLGAATLVSAAPNRGRPRRTD